ncbi:MAG: hypothetical protein FJ405_12455 [Verrucomicrobia bacterium]|nr:hypothetical protein [Verrucomicrobiota bacterium]
MGKYWRVLNIGIQNTLSYRVNFLFRALFGLIPLAAIISVWKTIYGQGQDKIGAYTLSMMVSYYLVVTLTDMLTAVAEDDWQIAADIREGRISQFLLKPIDYQTYRLTLFTSGRLIYSAVAFLPVAAFVWLQREHFVMPSNLEGYAAFGISIVLTALLQFFISYSMALLAFWLQEVSTFIFIAYAMEYLAGGHLFPLDILPAPLFQALMLTPFPYQLYFPVNVYLGKVQGTELWLGLCIQAAWTVAAYFLARWVWSRGVRRYEAVGG